MWIVIIILVIGGYIYLKGISEPAELKKLIQGRPQQQQDVIKYFFGKGGFLTKRITDAEYDNIVANTIKESNFKQKALAKIGLDESQVNENTFKKQRPEDLIDPLEIQGCNNLGWSIKIYNYYKIVKEEFYKLCEQLNYSIAGLAATIIKWSCEVQYIKINM